MPSESRATEATNFGGSKIDVEHPTLTYEDLGIAPVINAKGTMTRLGGSTMPPEVVAAWVQASRSFVDIVDLQQKAGQRIASLLNVPAALITTGAAGAIALGTAAAITRGDEQLVRGIPQSTGSRFEVILQCSHHSEYDSQLTAVGARLITVETIEQLEQAINPATAMMFFMNCADGPNSISRLDWARVARKHSIPTLMDASADLPPLERVSEYLQAGFDMLAISGGKAIRGPNDTGLLVGHQELIDAARANTSPHAPTFGRMMKVGKEDTMALLAAIERFVRLDHVAEQQEMARRVTVIENALRSIEGIRLQRLVPPIANHQLHLQVDWDRAKWNFSREEVIATLEQGCPPIAVWYPEGTVGNNILVSVMTLHPGEEAVVAERLRQIFKISE